MSQNTDATPTRSSDTTRKGSALALLRQMIQALNIVGQAIKSGDQVAYVRLTIVRSPASAIPDEQDADALARYAGEAQLHDLEALFGPELLRTRGHFEGLIGAMQRSPFSTKAFLAHAMKLLAARQHDTAQHTEPQHGKANDA